MLTLAIETSSAIGSVAVIEGDNCLAEKRFGTREHHSADLIPAVQKTLAKAKVRTEQINLWAVGLGPGSFMGIRVGIAAAKGFALATGKPIVGVPSFHAVAAEFWEKQCGAGVPAREKNKMADEDVHPTFSFAVVADAGRGELYYARYQPGQAILDTPIQLVANTPILQRSIPPAPRARYVAQLGREKFHHQKRGDKKLEPIYLRATKFMKARRA